MPKRFIFRQVFYGDLPIFLEDGAIRSKNFTPAQRCHSASYSEIVERRGTNEYAVPHGGVVNDYVAFYFAPFTSFAYAIHSEDKVRFYSPDREDLGVAKRNDRIFFVCAVDDFKDSGLEYCFSDIALNSLAPVPKFSTDLGALEDHVDWPLFDEDESGKIEEIGYGGACPWCHDMANPPSRQNRKRKRMAEFLVRNEVPLSYVKCIIARTEDVQRAAITMVNRSRWDIPVYHKPRCYF